MNVRVEPWLRRHPLRPLGVNRGSIFVRRDLEASMRVDVVIAIAGARRGKPR
jgi:hypothetical protein